ncbi:MULTISPECIES: hypothetical protein [unclassified Saccharibacter]|uniref:hypothetical protein n=1 Tax=unclassified Saccharibacter TaxID=2648722 RepID=UPI001329CE76|nr:MULTISPECIES: hypothetical protein [unclassified Saccharibacter]MXV36846.1 hypothetical protein [Saccharibacter sp. EH611]MXV58664.1 hypothetical protein [Saccharibacter sp. EH70]MXV66170.1 hypothetical protein [Saccharibacter sp. EH60]
MMSRSIPTPQAGRVVFFKGHRFIMLARTQTHAALCPIVTAPSVRHRADYALSWWDCFTLGAHDGDVVRCRPIMAPLHLLKAQNLSLSETLLHRLTQRARHEITRQDEETRYRGYQSSSLYG